MRKIAHAIAHMMTAAFAMHLAIHIEGYAIDAAKELTTDLALKRIIIHYAPVLREGEREGL